jgi:polysaccharide export outer membrane protein
MRPLCALFLLAACTPERHLTLPPDRLGASPAVTAGPGTSLRVTLEGVRAPALAPGWQVSATLQTEVQADGTVAVPGASTLPAQGLTAAQLARELERHGLEDVAPGGHVFVEFVNNPHQVVSVQGAVRRAGVLQWFNGMTMTTALTLSGGFTPSAKRQVTLTGPGRQPLSVSVDLEAIFAGKLADVAVLPLDILTVE